LFEDFLKQHDAAAWARTREELMASIHEIDQNATRIWFHFFPLGLADAFARTHNAAQLSNELRLEGNYRLADQCDTSHWFLYGHRYWPHAKAAVMKRAESTLSSSNVDLPTTIRDLASDAAAAAAVEQSLLVGISAVALMTLRQIGVPAFRSGPGTVQLSPAQARRSPAQIIATRKKDDPQGVLGIFRGIKAQYTVTFDERRDDARFTVINQQHLTTASANDTRDYSSGSRPCHEGPIPVQCRTASCGTCWIGILGGAEKLSPVEELEARRIKEFGYIDSTEAQPCIRLACMALAAGNVTIVIPPWNGFIGKAGLGGS
jgi:ferredoxin